LWRLGNEIKEAGENIPKPMVHVVDPPILWRIMKYYAHCYNDFILCLGYRGEAINNGNGKLTKETVCV